MLILHYFCLCGASAFCHNVRASDGFEWS